jgi:hypothetical protein
MRYISRAMQVLALSMDANMAGNASTPFLRSCTDVM